MKGHEILENTYIKISSTIDINELTDLQLDSIGFLMEYMNGQIGLLTDVNYNINEVYLKNGGIHVDIPIYVYTLEDSKLSADEIISLRFNTIIDFWKNFDWENNATNQVFSVLRIVYQINNSINDVFKLQTQYKSNLIMIPEMEEMIIFREYNLKFPKYRKKQLVDGSVISEVIDPYISDYGVFFDISIPFDEMGMSYNALHLFEHITTYGWKDLPKLNLKDTNAYTTLSGICMGYSIHENMKSMNLYFDAIIEWFLKTRAKNFWKDNSDIIAMETRRTISETRGMKSLFISVKSDSSSYGENYNTDIFSYWSNKPFNVLIVSPEKTDIDYNKIISKIYKNPIQNIIRPPDIKFDYIPIEVINLKNTFKYITKKISQEYIYEKLLDPTEYVGMYGKDCMVFEDDDLSEYNGVLLLLLTFNDIFSKSEINEHLRKIHIGFSASTYNEFHLYNYRKISKKQNKK